ncbi:hypothetical protein JCM10213v2_000071 [Rhodosporidiobolus nylandii]
MVALPSSSSQDASVNVAETEKEIKPFLAVIAGEGGKKGGELEKLDEEAWETLARLGDKYDCPAIVARVEARFWQLEADGRPPLSTPSPSLPFSIVETSSSARP